MNEIKRYSSNNEILYTHSYDSFDESGKVLKESSINNNTVNYLYNNRGQPSKIQTVDFESNGQYDDFGRLVLLTNTNKEITSVSSFGYNDLSQLTEEKGLFNNTYKYDSLDNKLQINEEPLCYSDYRLSAFGSSTYLYDEKGSLTKKITDQEETKFKNNFLSQLVEVEKNDKSVIHLTHDPLGRRLAKKTVNGPGSWAKLLSIDHFIYIGNLEIGSIDKNGHIQELRIPAIENGELSTKSVAIEIEGKPYIPIYDIMGNVASIIDPDNNKTVESYHYSAFGKEIISNSDGEQVEESLIDNPWFYRGKRLDKELGLLFFGIRYYDPEIGRWTNPDPLGTLDGPNPYAYVHNNPLNCVDRLGLSTESSWEGRERVCQFHDGQCYYVVSGPPGNSYAIGCWPRPQTDNITKLPKITYLDDFEDLFPHNSHSTMFDLGLEDKYNLGIGYTNGICNSLEDSQKSAYYISQLANGMNIHAVYNTTHGARIDLSKCSLGLGFYATTPVRLLHQTWDNFFENASSTALFLQICHSQGAINVRNALLDYPPDLRDRIMVVAIAPAGYMYQETCAKVIHYRAEATRDPVPHFDVSGASMAERQGTVKTLIFNPNANIFDHSFNSPTYRDQLKKNITNYINSQGKKI